MKVQIWSILHIWKHGCLIINHYNNITEKEQKRCSLDPNEIKKKNIEAKERFQKITKKEMNGKANCGYKRQKRKILVSHVK